MRTTAVLIAVVLAGGCGDNAGVPDAAEPACSPPPAIAPIAGAFADPLALALPPTCVTGGLAELPGRWFVRAPDRGFTFFYPKYEGSCDAGFRRANWIDDDADISDGFAFETWTDGTRLYTRELYRYEIPSSGMFELATAVALCMLPDGTLAGVEGHFDTDGGEELRQLVGTRFAPKDTGAAGLSLVGEVNFGISDSFIVGYNVAVDGSHAFVAGPLGFDAIDVTTPSAPVAIGHVDGRFNDVKLTRSASALVAYAAPIGQNGTKIIDVTNPAAPSTVGQIMEYSHSLFITPTTPPKLYLGNYTSTVPVFDLTNPLIPVRLGAAAVPGDPMVGIHDIHVASDRIYAFKTTEGVVALDVTAGLTAPTNLGKHLTAYSHAGWAGTAGGRQILIHGDEGMTPEGGALMRVLDADRSSATFMQEIGRYHTRGEVGIHNMQLVGDRAYIAYYQDGIRVVDLSDPTQPREIAHYNTWDEASAPGEGFEGAIGISVVGDLIYVADSFHGLMILRDDTN